MENEWTVARDKDRPIVRVENDTPFPSKQDIGEIFDRPSHFVQEPSLGIRWCIAGKFLDVT